MDDSLSDIFEDREFGNNNFVSPADDDLFAILESLEDFTDFPLINEPVNVVSTPKENDDTTTSTSRLVSQKSTSSSAQQDYETDQLETASPKSKRQKLTPTSSEDPVNTDGQQRISHITVERNRRKQMNEHLSVLRSLMPCFYVKRVSKHFACFLVSFVSYLNHPLFFL